MVRVSVSEGILEGEVVENEFGGSFCSFKGIPFAAPPVGDLRFKAPQPPQPWNGIRSAKEHGPICCQPDFLTGQLTGSEDCLYLNVYTPSIEPPAPLPVMVWIHGGAFVTGSGDESLYGPHFLIQHNVVIVTINYRVGMLGFLSLDTEDIPGNAGMKDQVFALRWVRKNIENFGGDPKNVTIFGESAGGGSVGYQLISPMSKGLFKRAIAQSGCSGNWWAHGFELRERALMFARQQGFFSEDDKELYEFFKNQPVSNLAKIKLFVELPVAKDHKSFEIDFGIANEKQFGNNERFFYGDPIVALKKGGHEGVEVMVGYTKDDGLIALGNGAKDKVINDANNFKEFFVPKQIKLEIPIKEQLAIGRKVKKNYIKENVIDDLKHCDGLLRFLNMDMFVHGNIQFGRFISSRNPTYLYKFSCSSERNVTAHLLGLGSIVKPGVVCHADDLHYLFFAKMLNMPVVKGSESAKMIETITTLWTNFAKYGNPTPDSSLGVTWKPFTVEHEDYLDIGGDLKPSTRPEREDMELWDDLFKQYLPSWGVTKHRPHSDVGVPVSRCRVTRNMSNNDSKL